MMCNGSNSSRLIHVAGALFLCGLGACIDGSGPQEPASPARFSASASTRSATGIATWEVESDQSTVTHRGLDPEGRPIFSYAAGRDGVHVQIWDARGGDEPVHELGPDGEQPSPAALEALETHQRRFSADSRQHLRRAAAPGAGAASLGGPDHRDICVSPEVAHAGTVLTVGTCGVAAASSLLAALTSGGAVAAAGIGIGPLAGFGAVTAVGASVLATWSWYGCGAMLTIDALTLGYWAICKFAKNV
jgi:hypothetical protein